VVRSGAARKIEAALKYTRNASDTAMQNSRGLVNERERFAQLVVSPAHEAE